MDEEAASQEMEDSPRKRTRNEGTSPIRQVQECWEMASLMNFLGAFADEVELPTTWTVDGLETALLEVGGNGTEVVGLHVALLRGMNPRSAIDETNWCTMAAKKIKAQPDAREEGVFRKWMACKSHQEADVHAQCTPIEKLKLLLLMCELRMCCEDIRSRIERAATVPKKRMDEEDERILNALRPSPLGVDAEGAKYWFLDAGNKRISRGFRLYKEVPRTPGTRTKATPVKWWEAKKPPPKSNLGGSKTSVPLMDEWRLVAHSMESMEDLGEYLVSGAARADRKLGAVILDSVVPRLQERKRREDKRQLATQRLHVALGNASNVLNADTAGRGRRVRKTVNYTFENFDKEIEDSIKAQNQQGDRRLPEKLSSHEANKLGLRRGRSAFPGDIAHEREGEEATPSSSTKDSSSVEGSQHKNAHTGLGHIGITGRIAQHDEHIDNPPIIEVTSADSGYGTDATVLENRASTQTSESEEDYSVQSLDHAQEESEENDTSDFTCSE